MDQANNKAKGIFHILLAAFGFAAMSLFVRLSGDLPTAEKAFFRNLIAAIVAIYMLWKSGQKLRVKKGCLPTLLLRSIAVLRLLIALPCLIWLLIILPVVGLLPVVAALSAVVGLLLLIGYIDIVLLLSVVGLLPAIVAVLRLLLIALCLRGLSVALRLTKSAVCRHASTSRKSVTLSPFCPE